MSLLDALGAKKEAEVFYETVSAAVSPAERSLIIRAGEALLRAIAWRALLKVGVPLGVVAAIGLTIFGSQVTGETPPGIATAPEINVVAREPGVDYNVAAFCNDPTTNVGTLPATDNAGTRYIASRGTEQVNWPDTGASPVATHYWTDQFGVHLQEPVEVTKDAAACLKKKAK